MRAVLVLLLHVLSAAVARDVSPADKEDGRQVPTLCPTAIRATIPSWRDDETRSEPLFKSMADIHAAMLRCSDVEVLQVRTALIGCDGWPDRFNFPFDIRGTDRYASAPVFLSLDGYEFERDDRDWSPCRGRFATFWDRLSHPILFWQCRQSYLRLPADQRDKTNLDLWLDAMDFSRIRTLQLNHTQGRPTLTEQVVQKLPPRLTSLESLTVHNKIAAQFILALPKDSLKHLSWQNPEDECGRCGNNNQSSPASLKSVLEHTGSTLQSLEYYTLERSTRAPSVPTLDELNALVNLAPSLKTLTLNLGRDNNTADGGRPQWPWGTLKLLAGGLRELTDLTIYFELASKCQRQRLDRQRVERVRRWVPGQCDEGECNMKDRYAQPMLNKTTAADMARFLWRHKPGKPLETLTFRSGDWNSPWDGPLREEQWLDWQRVKVTCRLRDPAGKGQADHIVCDEESWLHLHEWEKECRLMAEADAMWEQQLLQGWGDDIEIFLS